jgi:general secretion pathway protein D
MVMGGLITDNKQNSSAGLPLLSRIPIIGGLFGQQTLTNNRTELVMFITPRVVETEVDLKGVVDDLRRRMENLDDSFDVFRRQMAPVPGAATGKP